MVLAIPTNTRVVLFSGFAMLIGAGLMYLALNTDGPPPSAAGNEPLARVGAGCSYDIKRVTGFSHVKPLLSTEPVCPSPRYEALQQAIASKADSLRAVGAITSASVYVRDFVRGEWTCYNGDERFDPGSMLKVPLLICYLSMAEEDPSTLRRKFRCEPVDAQVPQNTAFPDKQAIPGAEYTIDQLLELAIVHSDNRSTAMLLRHLLPERYLNLFANLGLTRPDWKAKQYSMTSKDCSVFLKALYNSSLLSPINSEKALDLLLRSNFKEGLMSGLPDDIDVAHKFGESGNPNERQLHETGLVYLKGRPFLLTVMTRGKDTKELAKALGVFAHTVHPFMMSN